MSGPAPPRWLPWPELGGAPNCGTDDTTSQALEFATLVFPSRAFCELNCALFSGNRRSSPWYWPCLHVGMSEMPTHQGYDQPTVLWRMKRADGLISHAVVDVRASRAIVTWFVNHRRLGSRDFGDCASALHWCDQLQIQNWSVGWRLVSEHDDLPTGLAPS